MFFCQNKSVTERLNAVQLTKITTWLLFNYCQTYYNSITLATDPTIPWTAVPTQTLDHEEHRWPQLTEHLVSQQGDMTVSATVTSVTVVSSVTCRQHNWSLAQQMETLLLHMQPARTNMHITFNWTLEWFLFHYLCQGGYVMPGGCLFVCLLATLHKKLLNGSSQKFYHRCVCGQEELIKCWKPSASSSGSTMFWRIL